MIYIAFIIGGLIFGGFSDDAWGVWVGGIIGFLIAWVNSLSHKINKLESKLIDVKTKQGINSSAPNTNNQKPLPIQPQKPDIEAQVDNDPVSTVALSVDNESEVAVKQHSASDADESTNLPVEKPVVEQLAAAKPMDTPNNNLDKPIPVDKAAVSSASKSHKVPPKVTPSEPSAVAVAISKGTQKIKDLVVGYFTGGNSLVRTGMLVLFVGVAFLLKYVAERTVVPIEIRYIGVVAGSLLLLVLGWRLRRKRPAYALSLQGGGIGVLYLALFAAMRLHQLLPPSVVLLCLIVIVLLSASLAVLQNSMALAVIGVLGGFAAPILTSTGSGSHVQLFTYYLLLNLSVFGIAWFKSWRLLNLLGFLATFAVGSIWGAKYYQPAYFNSVEPFLIAHFLLYVLIAVLFAFKQPPKLKGINDGTLIFGTPVVVFSLQAALVKDMTYGLAYSALVLGVFYVLLAHVIKRLHRPFFKDLIESFIALGVGFATLAIPLGFDGRVTSAMWVAEASAMVWVGVRQSRSLPRFSGYALALLGSLAFFVEPAGSKDVLAFLNADFVGVIIVVAAMAFMGLYANKHADRLLAIEIPWIPRFMLISAVTWWTLGGLVELNKHFHPQLYLLGQMWLLVSVLVLLYWGQRLSLGLLTGCALVLNTLMLLLLVDVPADQAGGIMFWNVRFLGMLVVAVFYLFMAPFWQQNKWLVAASSRQTVSRYFLSTGAAVWLLAMILEIQLHFPISQLLWVEVMMASTTGALLWLGNKKHNEDFKWAAVVVALLMLLPVYLSMITHDWLVPAFEQDPLPVLNVTFMALLIFFSTHFMVAHYWQKNMPVTSFYNVMIGRVLLAFSLLAWVINGFLEAAKFFNLTAWFPIFLTFLSASFVLFIWAAHRLKWQDLHAIKYGFIPLLVLLSLLSAMIQPFHQAFGWLAWPFAFVVNYWLLKVYNNQGMKFIGHYHVAGLWILSFVLIHEFAALINLWLGYSNIWFNASYTVMGWLICAVVYGLRDRLQWPLVEHAKAYFKYALPVLMWVLFLLLLRLNLTVPGILLGVPYLPILNVIDVMGLLSIGLAVKVHQTEPRGLFVHDMRVKYGLLSGAVFLLLNATMLRCFHYWYDIDYQLKDLMSSFMVQTGFSILWAATAVTLMVLAARKRLRPVWLLGLALMIVVVAKLFLVDMSASGSIERIVAFLSVGFLLSLVGYFSPLPPDVSKVNKQEGVDHEHEA